MMVVVGPLLIWSQFRSDADDWRDAVTGTVAALIGMIPEGLVLLTSVAFMLAIVTLARKQTLVQELPAVEVLARVDVVCLDKTGTLTYGDIAFEAMELLAGADEGDVRRALALSATGSDTQRDRDRARRPVRRWPPTRRRVDPDRRHPVLLRAQVVGGRGGRTRDLGARGARDGVAGARAGSEPDPAAEPGSRLERRPGPEPT